MMMPSALPPLTLEELSPLLSRLEAPVREPLRAVLEDKSLSWQQALPLTAVTGPALHTLCLVADTLRQRQAGELVTYVVNRNINFTNVCVKTCSFCAFARGHRSEQGYLLEQEEVVRRAKEAQDLGATEVCLQAGIAPGLTVRYYADLVRAVRAGAPGIHVHGFSPEEVSHAAFREHRSVEDVLLELKEAGLGTLPGTAAEILDDALRDLIARGRLSTARWIEVVTTAHRLGLRTTATMMYGHLETPVHVVKHLDLLRGLQAETGGFTEFVPLSFVHQDSPLHRQGKIPGVRPGATGPEVIRTHALARLMLGASFRNIQASWVKDGMKLAQWLLSCGVNDLGGTLMNESISTSAGASHGQLMSPRALRRAVRECGRTPAERTTLYALRRVHDGPEEAELSGALDAIDKPEETFGSYRQLTAASDSRFDLTRLRQPRGE